MLKLAFHDSPDTPTSLRPTRGRVAAPSGDVRSSADDDEGPCVRRRRRRAPAPRLPVLHGDVQPVRQPGRMDQDAARRADADEHDGKPRRAVRVDEVSPEHAGIVSSRETAGRDCVFGRRTQTGSVSRAVESTRRFRVTFDARRPTFTLGLLIQGISSTRGRTDHSPGGGKYGGKLEKKAPRESARQPTLMRRRSNVR